jgi:hypothetical protein
MRTIDKILGYTLTDDQESLLRQSKIVNGIGGEGANIEKALRANIELLP